MLTILTHSYLVYRVVYYRLCVCAVNDVIKLKLPLYIFSLQTSSLSKNTHFFLPTKFWIKKSISKSSLVEHPPKASSLSVCGVVFWRRVKEEEEKKCVVVLLLLRSSRRRRRFGGAARPPKTF